MESRDWSSDVCSSDLFPSHDTAQADAVMMGGSTFRAHPKPLRVRGAALTRQRVKNGKSAQPATVVISRTLNFPLHTDFEKAKDIERWIFCEQASDKNTRRRLSASGVRIEVSERGWQAKEILAKLQAAGHRKVLLEGGGEVNALFFEADAVDFIYLTLCPVLIGGRESPTIFAGKGLREQFPLFRVLDEAWIAGELYLVFQRWKGKFKTPTSQ